MRLPTIRDVAREAGVGVGTVSRVLNTSPQVRPQTRQRVLDTIQRLGFRPNQLARQLSRGTSVRNVGVLSRTITDHAFTARLQGVQRALYESEFDYELVLYHVSSSQRFDEQLLTLATQGNVEGILLIALSPSPQQQELLDDNGLAYVGIHDCVIKDWPSIGADNIVGGRMATRYLLELGHRRIAYVGDQFPTPEGILTSQHRLEGYKKALTEHNIEANADYIQLGKHSKEVAYHLTRNLLELSTPPTAIFSMSDIQALGCLAAIRDADLSVPKDVSLIGFDDVELSALIGLTTVRQHLEEAGYLAMKYLLRLVGDPLASDDEPVDHRPQLPAFEIVARQTTRPWQN